MRQPGGDGPAGDHDDLTTGGPHGGDLGHGVVYVDLPAGRRSRKTTLIAGVGSCPPCDAGTECKAPGEGFVHHGNHRDPLDRGTGGRLHDELRGRHPVGAVGRSVQHVEAADGHDTGDAAEQQGLVVGNDSKGASAAVDRPSAAGHEFEGLGRREIGPTLTELPLVQEVLGPLDQLSNEVGLPRSPRRWSGGLGVGLGQRGQQMKELDRVDRRGDRFDGAGVGEVPAGGDVR